MELAHETPVHEDVSPSSPWSLQLPVNQTALPLVGLARLLIFHGPSTGTLRARLCFPLTARLLRNDWFSSIFANVVRSH